MKKVSVPVTNSVQSRGKQSQVTELAGAFSAFNELSEQLLTAYSALEQRVAKLTEELAAARDERLHELMEKERLALRLQQLLQALPGAIVVIDGDGLVQECNDLAKLWLGQPLAGESWRHVAARSLTQTPDEPGEWVVGLRRVSLSTSALLGEPGQIILLQDVTDTRRLHQSLDRQRRLSAMGEMIASLAHQLRTPLATALLYVSHARSPRLQAQEREHVLDRLTSRLRHLDAVVNDMLGFARGSDLTLVRVNVAELVRELSNVMENLVETRDATLVVDEPLTNVVVTGNRTALLGVLQNLVTNAIDAGGVHVTVVVGVSRDGGEVVIRVTDDGPGIEPEVKERIFEPFFTTRPNGTGLGLAVVRSVVMAHGGTIDVTDDSCSGAQFEIRLPVFHEESLLASGQRAVSAIRDNISGCNPSIKSEVV